MAGSFYPINPYLATLINGMEAQVPEEKLRAEYQQLGGKLSWLEFLGERALRNAINDNPVLRMRRSSFPLPGEILDGLYWLRVDVLADLLQISEEELRLHEKQENLDVDMVEGFLIRNGLKLYHGTKDSWKIPALRIIDPDRAGRWEQWDLASLEGHKMHPARPAVVQEWFDQYYKRYEYLPSEEKLSDEWLGIKPKLEDGEIPSDLKEYFDDTRLFFDAYKTVCAEQGIPMHVEIPDVPGSPDELESFSNDRYVSIKKDVVRAVISVLENTNLLKMPTFKFLNASDEMKLNIAEKVKNNEDFQYFLIEYVAIRVDFENLFDYFDVLADKVTKKEAGTCRPDPINPWLAELILKYRKQHSDDSIREEYRLFCEHIPDKSWVDFLAEQALEEESLVNSFIRTALKDCDLPTETKDILSHNCDVENMADLLQITKEELEELLEERSQDISVIEKLLEEHALHLYHSDRYTYKKTYLF